MGDRPQRIHSGISGLDEVLCGGLVTGRMYLVCGRPGTGKTILGMHFLEAGLDRGETVLFIHGEESKREILVNGTELDVDLADAEFLDLGPESEFFTEDRSYDLVDPSDIDHDRYTRDIHDAIRSIDPDRVFLDPITQLRYIEANEHQYRKRILSFMRFLKERDVTVIASATTRSENGYDANIESLSDGVVRLRNGENGRRLEVTKHRGYGQLDGSHGMEIRGDGLEVYPALVPERHERSFDSRRLQSGVDGIDELLGGGIERGTVTFVSGPTGSGKTTTATQFLARAASEGIDTAAFLFEEGVETFTHRSDAVGIPLTELRDRGTLSIRTVEPLALSAEEFARLLREHVEQNDVEVVLLDGIGGYTMSIQGREQALVRKIHALTRYLKNRGVTVLITDEVPDVTGITSATSSNLSYVADNVVFISYVETRGTLRKVIGVLKKRASGFEHTLREFEITSDGIRVGEPLTELAGVLQGTPRVRPSAERNTD